MSPSASAPGNDRRATLQDEDDFINMLYLGDPGSGKTTAAAHMAHLGKVIWVCGENGLIKRRLQELGVPVENIELYTDISYKALEDLHMEVLSALTQDPRAYAGVVFDTFSEVQGRLIEAKAKSLLVSQNEYGVNTSEMTRLLRKYTDLKCHIVWVTHAKREKDPDGQLSYRSDMTPKVSATLEGLTKIACHVEARPRTDSEEADYIGYTRPHFKRAGKDRFGCLPPMLFNPTFDRIEAYVSGRYLRGAQLEADGSGEVPDGLDPLQYEYRRRMAAVAATPRTEEE